MIGINISKKVKIANLAMQQPPSNHPVTASGGIKLNFMLYAAFRNSHNDMFKFGNTLYRCKILSEISISVTQFLDDFEDVIVRDVNIDDKY